MFSPKLRRARAIVASVAITIACVAGATLTTSPAHAASGDVGYIASATVRSCPDTRCGATVQSVAGYVPVWCWRDAGSFNGTVRWFRVTVNSAKGWVSASQMPQQPVVPYCSDMLPGENLYSGQSMYSQNGQYRLVQQGDGNLVLYGPAAARWATMTFGSNNFTAMQGDANLVTYTGGAPWATMTTGYSNIDLVVQDDGNLVLYSNVGAIWAASWHMTVGVWRTTNRFAAGNCTWYAAERFKAFWGSHQYPGWSGDAWQWGTNAAAAHWQVNPMPMTQAVVVFPKSSTSSLGHVAWVDAMQLRSDGQYIHIVEMNAIGFNVVSDRWLKASPGWSYIPAPAL
jgi:surface antigen